MIKNLKINAKLLACILGVSICAGYGSCELAKHSSSKSIEQMAKDYSNELKNRDEVSINDIKNYRFYSTVENDIEKYYLVNSKVIRTDSENEYCYYYDVLTGEVLRYYEFMSQENKHKENFKTLESLETFIQDNEGLEKEFYTKKDLEDIYNLYVEKENNKENEAYSFIQEQIKNIENTIKNQKEFSFNDYKSFFIAKTNDNQFRLITHYQISLYDYSVKCYFDVLTGELILEKNSAEEILYGEKYEMYDPFIDYFDIEASDTIYKKEELLEYLNKYISDSEKKLKLEN